eukprot:TRINITY_DN11914_c0_g1_i1.p1 TRINITY_DN11914_c0_g1~~TRINITY_DN11914_c0_g1_i1.p1  ORF type:complete len:106 (+),score=3.41 TRINITY_DN11914_c0_g1_i1:31-318(+)
MQRKIDTTISPIIALIVVLSYAYFLVWMIPSSPLLAWITYFQGLVLVTTYFSCIYRTYKYEDRYPPPRFLYYYLPQTLLLGVPAFSLVAVSYLGP